MEQPRFWLQLVSASTLWLLPVVSLALGLALWRGLRPLYALSADVAALDPTSAQRLASRHAWSEFESVVAKAKTVTATAAATPQPNKAGTDGEPAKRSIQSVVDAKLKELAQARKQTK